MSRMDSDSDFHAVPDGEEEHCSSIDDDPQVVPSDDKFLSYRLYVRNDHCLQQSLKFHLGKPVTNPPEEKPSLPDIVPTGQAKKSNLIRVPLCPKETDQLVPDLSTNESGVIPDNLLGSPTSPNSDQGFYPPNSPGYSSSKSLVLPNYLTKPNSPNSDQKFYPRNSPDYSTSKNFFLTDQLVEPDSPNSDQGFYPRNSPDYSPSKSFFLPGRLVKPNSPNRDKKFYSQNSPDYSRCDSFVIPDHLLKHNLLNINQEFHLQNRQGHTSFKNTQPNNDYMPIEWRSTKLSSENFEALSKALLCFSQRCLDPVCKKGKYLLDELTKKIQAKREVDSETRQILVYLLEHLKDCDEYFCIAPGCHHMGKTANTLGELIDCIDNSKNHELKYTRDATFHGFSKIGCLRDVDETTWCSHANPDSISMFQNNRWTKVTVLGDIMQDILPLLKKIGYLSNHPNILPIDWLIDDGIIYYSSEHYIEALNYKIANFVMRKKEIILQLIDAALYLNANNIAFLAWTTENIGWKNDVPMLTNFHMGSALCDDFEPGVIKCLLFPTIVPPELHTDNPTLEKADVWGVCCLLYELLTGEVVNSHLLHMERDKVWRKLDMDGWRPNCSFPDPQLQDIFRKGWEVNPQTRCTLNTLKCDILKLKSDF